MPTAIRSCIDRGALNFVIVGAGATGVETAGALADLINDIMPAAVPRSQPRRRPHPRGRPGSCGPGAVLRPRPRVRQEGTREEGRAARARREGRRRSPPDRVVLSDGREILTRTVVWAGGIQAAAVAAHTGIPPGHGGRLDVQSRSHGRGRSPASTRSATWPTPRIPTASRFPQLGSVALQAGRCVGRRTSSPTSTASRARRSSYRDKGIMAMIGRNAAIAEVGPRRRELHGPIAFLSWLGVHAALLSGFRERMTALRSWAWDYLDPEPGRRRSSTDPTRRGSMGRVAGRRPHTRSHGRTTHRFGSFRYRFGNQADPNPLSHQRWLNPLDSSFVMGQ